MSPIKDLKLVYEAVRKDNVFTTGDAVIGALSFTLKDDAKLKKVVVKLKGGVRVHWSEGSGDRRRSHTDTREYFNIKKYFVEEKGKGEAVEIAEELRNNAPAHPYKGGSLSGAKLNDVLIR